MLLFKSMIWLVDSTTMAFFNFILAVRCLIMDDTFKKLNLFNIFFYGLQIKKEGIQLGGYLYYLAVDVRKVHLI
jgi:hypothetical protein